MELTKSQKKYLRKNYRSQSIPEISRHLNVPEAYLKNSLEKSGLSVTTKNNQSPNTESQFNLNWFKTNLRIFVFLGILIIVTYLNSLHNDFVSDDVTGILQNPNIGNLSHLKQIPLSFLRDFFYFVAYSIDGLNPIFFRLINVFFHLGSTWIIFVLLSLIFNSRIGLITASIFAVHPLEIEAVTWISGGPYSQYSFFLLLSFLFYVLASKKQSNTYYFSSIVAFILSLLSTEKGAVFPLILILYEFSFGNLKNNWKKTIPFWIISFGWFFLFLTQGMIGGRMSALQNNYYQEKGLENPFVQIPVAISSYLNLIFIPIGMTLYHSEEMIMSTPIYIIRICVLLIYLGSLVYFIKKNRALFFWLAFFFISLWPVLTPLKISWIVAERYVYLGALGIYVFIAVILEKLGDFDKNQKIPYFVLAIILPLLGILTIIRNSEWKNQDTLWFAAAKTSPSSPQNRNNLGDYYSRNKDFNRAIEEFTIATKLKPNYGDAYHNLANTYHQIGNYDLALENYQKALIFNPNLWQTHQNMAAIYYDQSKYDLSIQELKKAIAISPNESNIHTILGIVYSQTGDNSNAKIEFEIALKLNPQNDKIKQLLESIKP